MVPNEEAYAANVIGFESGVVMVKALGQLSFGIELKRLHDPDSMLFGVVDNVSSLIPYPL